MQCPHCKKGLKFDGERLICPDPSCDYRKDTPYKKVPSQEELFKKNADLTAKYKILYDKLAQIKDVINNAGTPARKIADITEIVE